MGEGGGVRVRWEGGVVRERWGGKGGESEVRVRWGGKGEVRVR